MEYSKPTIVAFGSAAQVIQRTLKDDTFFIESDVFLLSLFAYEADE
jgi:hypothetical protein